MFCLSSNILVIELREVLIKLRYRICFFIFKFIIDVGFFIVIMKIIWIIRNKGF